MYFQYHKQHVIFILLIFLLCILLFFYQQCFSSALAASVMQHINLDNLHIHQNTFLKKNHLLPATLNNKKKYNSNIITTGSGTDTPWSNAFNFKKIWGTEIDPRTGILSAHVKAGNLLSNWGHGPNIDLEINYSSNAYADTDKLGYGWKWNLTYFNPITHQLTTSTGQNFYLQQKNNSQWFPLYHKLKDILIMTDKNHLVITYANGLRETLDDAGYETSLEQQNGWSVHFSYQPGTHLLQSVTDDEHHSILLNYKENYIKVISKNSEGQPVSVLICKKKGKVRAVKLPVQNNDDRYSIRFYYTGHLITQVSYPTGLKKTFTYNCNDEMKIRMPVNAATVSLCVVSGKTVDPGAGQPLMITHYRYTQTNSNEHNYLGFNAGLEQHISTFKDMLFEAPVSYTYRTLEDNGITQEIRTYNKYHLLIDDQQISDHTWHKLSEVQSLFCRTDQRDGCAHSSFADLPATYSQPLKIVTKLWDDKDTSGLPAITSETSQYDQQGRVVSHTDSYGRLTKIHYCPTSGDTACPAAPKEWPFSNLTESAVLYPAHTDDSATVYLPPVITYNYYRKQPNRFGNGYILIMDHQIQRSGQQYRITTRRYYQDKSNAFNYGLLKQTIFTGNIKPSAKLASVIQDYYYTKSTDNRSKTTWSAIELNTNKKRLSSYITTSLFTNHVLQNIDASGQNVTRHHYDLWDRLIQTDTTVGTPFASSNHYQYTISPLLNQVLVTAANGMQSKVIFDGAGRQLMTFDEAVSAAGKAMSGHWILKDKTTYDQYGRSASQSVYLFDASNKLYALTTTQEYDDSGRVKKIHLPDQETAVTLYNDTDRCVVSYQKSSSGKRSAVSVVKSNLLYKPVRQWVLPANDDPLPSLKTICARKNLQTASSKIRLSQMTYDGFGRLIKSTDPMGHIVKKHYNAPGQLTDVTDPVGDKIHYVYDLTGHTIQSWAQPVSGGNYLLSSAKYNAAGELLWKAGEDGQHTIFTYSEYGKPVYSTSPAGHTATVKYNQLGLPVATFLDGKLQSQFTYDHVTMLITRQQDMTGTAEFIYDDDGLIRQQLHKEKNGYLNYNLYWYYDNNRRSISVTDISKNKTQTVYDVFGRVTNTLYQQDYSKKKQILSTFTYDDFSRVVTIQYGSGMHRSVHYDHLDHADTVTDTLNNTLLSRWSFHYDLLDNIIEKTYQTMNQIASFHYQYDALNNLVRMTCSSTSANALCPRDTVFKYSGLKNAPVITEQNYYFTPLNQLLRIHEQLQNPLQQKTLSKVTNYRYTDNSAPLRLQTISTNWNNHSPVTHHFNYDIMGNMTIDGEGNHIVYNAFNQILQVDKSDGQQSTYTYDSSGKEVMEKSSAGTSYLFYRGHHLINETVISPEQDIHIIGYQGAAKTIDGIIHTYNESNYKGDVVAILTRTEKNHNVYKLSQRNLYSPYGMHWHDESEIKPLYQQTLMGFDGERTDPATGWQFLGAGHRTYNPGQRYFVSEDPAGNGYGFGSNNPIMNSDPTGNIPEWIGTAFKWLGYVGSFGLNALHAKWAHIAGAVITTGLTIATLGASAYTYGGSVIASAVTAGATITGSIPVVASVIPANKGLNIAASVTGGIEMAAMVVTAAVDAGLFFISKIQRPTMTMFTFEERNNVTLQHFEVNILKEGRSHYFKFDPASLLKSVTPELIVEEDNNYYIQMYSYYQIQQAWFALRSINNSLVASDTGCILMAIANSKRFDLADLTAFFDYKFNFINSAINSQRCIYDTMVKSVPDYYTQTLSFFKYIIKKINQNYQFLDYHPPKTSLEEVVVFPFHIYFIITQNSIHPVSKFIDCWELHYFGNNDFHIIFGTLNEIEQIIFSHVTSETNERKILSSARLIYEN